MSVDEVFMVFLSLVKYFDDSMFEEVLCMSSHKTFLQEFENGKFKISFNKDNRVLCLSNKIWLMQTEY